MSQTSHEPPQPARPATRLAKPRGTPMPSVAMMRADFQLRLATLATIVNQAEKEALGGSTSGSPSTLARPPGYCWAWAGFVVRYGGGGGGLNWAGGVYDGG